MQQRNNNYLPKLLFLFLVCGAAIVYFKFLGASMDAKEVKDELAYGKDDYIFYNDIVQEEEAEAEEEEQWEITTTPITPLTTTEPAHVTSQDSFLSFVESVLDRIMHVNATEDAIQPEINDDSAATNSMPPQKTNAIEADSGMQIINSSAFSNADKIITNDENKQEEGKRSKEVSFKHHHQHHHHHKSQKDDLNHSGNETQINKPNFSSQQRDRNSQRNHKTTKTN